MPSYDGLTAGASNTLYLSTPDGILDFELPRSFQMKEDAVVLKKVLMNQDVRHPKLSQGWSGSLVLERGSSALDKYINQQEANFFLGGDQVDATLLQTIQEADGSITQFQFKSVVMLLENAGNYEGSDTVMQTLTLYAKRRLTLL